MDTTIVFQIFDIADTIVVYRMGLYARLKMRICGSSSDWLRANPNPNPKPITGRSADPHFQTDRLKTRQLAYGVTQRPRCTKSNKFLCCGLVGIACSRGASYRQGTA